MNSQINPMLFALNDLDKTTDRLIEALQNSDTDKAHEAISIMLMQGMDHFGPDHIAMQQFFPVWNIIKGHIDGQNIVGALFQTETWQSQLHEIIVIVSNKVDLSQSAG